MLKIMTGGHRHGHKIRISSRHGSRYPQGLERLLWPSALPCLFHL